MCEYYMQEIREKIYNLCAISHTCCYMGRIYSLHNPRCVYMHRVQWNHSDLLQFHHHESHRIYNTTEAKHSSGFAVLIAVAKKSACSL
jgi:hypothetical protein